jgi:hypothetical protein
MHTLNVHPCINIGLKMVLKTPKHAANKTNVLMLCSERNKQFIACINRLK